MWWFTALYAMIVISVGGILIFLDKINEDVSKGKNNTERVLFDKKKKRPTMINDQKERE